MLLLLLEIASMDGNGGKSAVGVDPPVHYPQLQQEAMQGASAPPPPYAPMVQQPLPIQQTGEWPQMAMATGDGQPKRQFYIGGARA